MKLIYTLALAFFIVVNTHAATIYVRPGATGNGATWTNAAGSLTNALATANSGDMIWVAQGTYKPSATGNTDTSFHLKNGVAVYG